MPSQSTYLIILASVNETTDDTTRKDASDLFAAPDIDLDASDGERKLRKSKPKSNKLKVSLCPDSNDQIAYLYTFLFAAAVATTPL